MEFIYINTITLFNVLLSIRNITEATFKHL
jgi:hypothetical protein